MSKSERKRIRVMLMEKIRRCPCCGMKFEWVFGSRRFPTIDHRIPKSCGGGDDVSNLRIMCAGCNELRESSVYASALRPTKK